MYTAADMLLAMAAGAFALAMCVFIAAAFMKALRRGRSPEAERMAWSKDFEDFEAFCRKVGSRPGVVLIFDEPGHRVH